MDVVIKFISPSLIAGSENLDNVFIVECGNDLLITRVFIYLSKKDKVTLMVWCSFTFAP